MGGILETRLNKVGMYSFDVFPSSFFGCGDILIFVCELAVSVTDRFDVFG
jgi:hypothetical protein